MKSKPSKENIRIDKMRTMVRELMQFEMKSFYDMPQSEIEGWISHVLLNGFKGFNKMTYTELENYYEGIKQYE
jgi:hypothetical protein